MNLLKYLAIVFSLVYGPYSDGYNPSVEFFVSIQVDKPTGLWLACRNVGAIPATIIKLFGLLLGSEVSFGLFHVSLLVVYNMLIGILALKL
jgi:hypothetical protein